MSETLIKELKRQAALQRLNGWDDLARQTEKKIAKLKGKASPKYPDGEALKAEG